MNGQVIQIDFTRPRRRGPRASARLERRSADAVTEALLAAPKATPCVRCGRVLVAQPGLCGTCERERIAIRDAVHRAARRATNAEAAMALELAAEETVELIREGFDTSDTAEALVLSERSRRRVAEYSVALGERLNARGLCACCEAPIDYLGGFAFNELGLEVHVACPEGTTAP